MSSPRNFSISTGCFNMSDQQKSKLRASLLSSSQTRSSRQCVFQRTTSFRSSNQMFGFVEQRRSASASSMSSSALALERCCASRSTKNKSREQELRNQICSMRKWEYSNLGRKLLCGEQHQPQNSVKFTVLSYNVLAQVLLEEHPYLYRESDPEDLSWEKRAQRILREVKDCQADVLCLQEVQSDHFDTFYFPSLKKLGFEGIFKKRTGDKQDGCAIFWRTCKFNLKSSTSVEYWKSNVKLLDRDNIGLIALLTPKPRSVMTKQKANSGGNEPFICIATTHLLYNPKRHDIKLAQLQLLFAELDHIAYKGGKNQQQLYHPIILTGDFNLTPKTSAYQFITGGYLQYKGLSRELTATFRGQRTLDNELIPPQLNVTDRCQHLHSLEKRLVGYDSRELVSQEAKETQIQLEIEDGQSQKFPSLPVFSSGELSHSLSFSSVYPHTLNRLNGAEEVTTRQKDWVTVDYIFHNGDGKSESSLHLLSRLGLLAGRELDIIGRLPNAASPSDHLPLAASFLWNYGR